MGYADRMDRQRIVQTRADVVKMEAYNFDPSKIINFDEKGFLIGQLPKSMVLCRRARAHRHQLQDGSREFITVI